MAKWRAEKELRRCSLWALRAPALGAEAALLTLAVEAGQRAPVGVTDTGWGESCTCQTVMAERPERGALGESRGLGSAALTPRGRRRKGG